MKKKLIALALSAALATSMATTAMALPGEVTGDAVIIQNMINKYYASWLAENGGSTVADKEGNPVCALQFTQDGSFNVYFYDAAVETIVTDGMEGIVDSLSGAGTGLISTLNAAIQEYYTINPDATDVKVKIGDQAEFTLSADKGTVDVNAFAQQVGAFYGDAMTAYTTAGNELTDAEDYKNFLNNYMNNSVANDLAFTIMEDETAATTFQYEMQSQTVSPISNTSAASTTETLVTYYVAPSYSVYIPEAVTLDSQATIYATEASLEDNTQVDVKIVKDEKTTMLTGDDTGTKFAVALKDQQLAYTINTDYKVGDVLCSFTQVGESQVTFSAPETKPNYAGTYTGTLLFSVELAPRA